MYTGDVALLELSAPLKLNDMVGSVCLAEAASIDSEQLCLTAGWGSDLENTATTEQYLKYLPVPTVPTERCNSSIHYNGVLPENAICAGFLNSNKTTCYVSIFAYGFCACQPPTTSGNVLTKFVSHYTHTER